MIIFISGVRNKSPRYVNVDYLGTYFGYANSCVDNLTVERKGGGTSMSMADDHVTPFEKRDPNSQHSEIGGLDHEGFGELFQLSPVPMAVYSNSYVPVAINKAFSELLGVPHDTLLTVPTIGYFHPDEQRRAREGMEKVLRGGGVPPTAFFRIFCADAVFRHIETSSSLTSGIDGTVYLLVLFRDISEEVWNRGQ